MQIRHNIFLLFPPSTWFSHSQKFVDPVGIEPSDHDNGIVNVSPESSRVQPGDVSIDVVSVQAEVTEAINDLVAGIQSIQVGVALSLELEKKNAREKRVSWKLFSKLTANANWFSEPSRAQIWLKSMLRV